MKIALVLTGHMRCYKEGYDSFAEHILNRADADVFIETWTEVGFYTGQGYKKARADGFIQTEDTDKGYVPGDLIDRDEIETLYKPKVFEIEDFSSVESSIEKRKAHFPNAYTRPKNTISMFYKMQKGLVRMFMFAQAANIQYDLVIRTRPDLVIQSELPSSYNSNIFYHNPGSNSIGKGIGDQFHMSGMLNMAKFSHIFDHLEDMYDRIGYSCPHMFCETFLKDTAIPYSTLNIPMKIMHGPHGPYKELDGSVYEPKE